MSDALQLLLLVLSYPTFRACRYLVERSEDVMSQQSRVDGAPPPVATKMNAELGDHDDRVGTGSEGRWRDAAWMRPPTKWPKKKRGRCNSYMLRATR